MTEHRTDQPGSAVGRGATGGAEERHFAGSWLSDVLRLVARKLGDEAVPGVLARAGERRTLDVVLDPATWSSHDQFRAVAQAAGEALGGPEALIDYDELMLESDSPGEYIESQQALGSPAAACAAMTNIGATVGTTLVYAGEPVGDDGYVLTVATRDGFDPFAELCALNMGILRSLPKLFGFTDVEVVEQQCQTRGASQCVFRLHWSVANEDARRAALNELRARVLEARLRHVHSLVTQLAGHDHVATLQRILAEFTEAALAAAGVLVSEDPRFGTRTVYAAGVEQDEGERLAAEIDAGLRRDDPALHVIEIRSARARYGYLAAAGSIMTEDIASHLEPHARLAAVALDLITSQRALQCEVRSAESMVELSSALAEIVSPGEIASRLARATPAIVDCERVLVFLAEDVGGQPLLSAAHGHDEEALARVRASLFGHAIADDAPARDRIAACVREAACRTR